MSRRCVKCLKGKVVERYVTHEMALDAGDLQYEGQPIEDTCLCCGGNWEDCIFCTIDKEVPYESEDG